MLQVGAHVSISDGFDSAVEDEVKLGGNVGQIFVGSPQGWSVSEVSEEQTMDFSVAHEEHEMGPWIVHGTYLINFATPKDDLGEKSVRTVQAELDICDQLSIPYYTFHPGSHTGAGVSGGIENIGERLSKLDIPDSATLLLENTAGKGTSLGKTFEQLDQMVAASTKSYGEIGVCLDSCHLFAAGYNFTTDEGLDDMVDELAEDVGLEHVHYLHLNDSMHDLGSEKDEHQHIGEGKIGDEGFRNLINHDAFYDLPMVLETPTNGKGYAENVERVKSLYTHDD